METAHPVPARKIAMARAGSVTARRIAMANASPARAKPNARGIAANAVMGKGRAGKNAKGNAHVTTNERSLTSHCKRNVCEKPASSKNGGGASCFRRFFVDCRNARRGHFIDAADGLAENGETG